jgi:hypothetical protein
MADGFAVDRTIYTLVVMAAARNGDGDAKSLTAAGRGSIHGAVNPPLPFHEPPLCLMTDDGSRVLSSCPRPCTAGGTCSWSEVHY